MSRQPVECTGHQLLDDKIVETRGNNGNAVSLGGLKSPSKVRRSVGWLMVAASLRRKAEPATLIAAGGRGRREGSALADGAASCMLARDAATREETRFMLWVWSRPAYAANCTCAGCSA